MAKVAILTPDPSDEGFHTRWRDVFAELVAALEAGGLAVEGRAWSDDAGSARFDLVLPLLVWGYHRAGRQWLEAIAGWERSGAQLQNPQSVLRWNADKTYLARLAERGAPVVPTVFADKVSERLLAQAIDSFGTDRLIAKPQVSASAWQTIRWSPGEPLDGGPSGPTMIQPYLPSIEQSGETSLVYFAGAFSHAIRKVPRPGDFRVQPEYQAVITPHPPSADELSAAEAILAAAGEELLYARVDLVRDLDGQPVLMELELVEPDLYIGCAEGAGAAFAAAARAAASRIEPAEFGL